MSEDDVPKTMMISPAQRQQAQPAAPEGGATMMLDAGQLAAQTSGPRATFVVHLPSGQERTVEMRSLSLTIGRGDQCDIVLKDGSVSTRHCEIAREKGQIIVRDLGSSNGVFVNGRKLEEASILDGDIIKVGQSAITARIEGGPKAQGAEAARDPERTSRTGLAVGIAAAVLVLGGGGALVLGAMQSRARAAQDQKNAAQLVQLAQGALQSDPCGAVADKMNELALLSQQRGQLPRYPASRRERAGIPSTLKALQREAQVLSRVVDAMNNYSLQQNTAIQAIGGVADGLHAQPLRDEAQALMGALQERSKLTEQFIGDWKRLSGESAQLSGEVEQIFQKGDARLVPAYNAYLARPHPPAAPIALRRCKMSDATARDKVQQAIRALQQALPPSP